MAKVARLLLVLLLIIALCNSSETWNADAASGRELGAVVDGLKVKQLSKDGEDEEAEYFMDRRIDFKNNDYPGAGANNHHIPKPPPAGD